MTYMSSKSTTDPGSFWKIILFSLEGEDSMLPLFPGWLNVHILEALQDCRADIARSSDFLRKPEIQIFI